MANTYKKVYLHIVFAVKNREALIDKRWRPKLLSYISGTLKNRDHFPIAVNGYHDHIHILFEYNLKELVSDLVREVKKSSSSYIKENKFSPFQFKWQAGFGVFSVGWRELNNVAHYINDQEKHHSKRSFKDEYVSLLQHYKVEYKDEYVFDFLD